MAYDIYTERQEAIDAGKRALYSLETAQAELEGAKRWGFVDLLGGGFLTSMIKHSKMGNASAYMEQAREDLERFGRELQDINVGSNLYLETNDFLQFADWFFDGLIADWLVQERIHDARAQVEEAIYRVSDIVRKLEMEQMKNRD